MCQFLSFFVRCEPYYSKRQLYNKSGFKMNKLSLEEINRLANESDDGSTERNRRSNHKQGDSYEQQQFEKQNNEPIEEIEQGYDQNFNEQSIKQQSHGIPDQQVKSQIEEQNNDRMSEYNIKGDKSVSQFKKDQDMSLAESEFIESQRLNNSKNKLNSKDKLSKAKFQDKNKLQKNKVIENKKVPKKNEKIQKQPVKPQKEQKVRRAPIKPKKPIEDSNVQEKRQKPKLTDSEIKSRMNKIKQEKQQLLKRKQERQNKDVQIRRQEYEQAKKIEEQRKQKNKLILLQQKKKKKLEGNEAEKSRIKVQEEEIKLPQKRTDFKYMEMTKQRKEMEKKIQKQIEEDNKSKLKRILEKPQNELKGQARKAAFLAERKVLRERQNKMKQQQTKEQDVLVVRQVKKEINECRKFNLQKQEQINRTEKTIAALSKKLKDKEKKYFEIYAGGIKQEVEQVNDFSELTPIQKFVYCFPQAKNPDEIFKLIDANGDGLLSSQEIKSKLQEFKLDTEVIKRVQEILDQNSDGTVSNEQFVFIIDLELKKQKDYRQIMGTLEINDPLDLEAKIIDMQAKIKFINSKIEKYNNRQNDEDYHQKIQNLEQKAKKLQSKWKKEAVNYASNDNQTNMTVNILSNLTNEAIKLKSQKNTKLAFIQKLRAKVKDNLKEKNKLLTSRVEEGLRLTQQLFNIKNQIQQRELRYLSLKKIEQNKKGYLERQSKKQKQLEQAYKRTKQYQISIADPSKKAQNLAQRDEMRLLAAVLMIQRNYRRRKARGEFLKLKQQKK